MVPAVKPETLALTATSLSLAPGGGLHGMEVAAANAVSLKGLFGDVLEAAFGFLVVRVDLGREGHVSLPQRLSRVRGGKARHRGCLFERFQRHRRPEA